MFTGIVEELGEVLTVRRSDDSAVLTVQCGTLADATAEGDSIAVSGVCLTVVHRRDGTVSFDVMAETLRCTSLDVLRPGDEVNLERATPVTGRLGGHIVQGHVDGTAAVSGRFPGDRWEVVRIELPGELSRYLAPKGSIAVDGVSLTVSAVGADYFEVSLIPVTLARTTLGRKPPGALVNLEVDVLAKYVERLLQQREPSTGLAR